MYYNRNNNDDFLLFQIFNVEHIEYLEIDFLNFIFRMLEFLLNVRRSAT